MAAYKLQVGMQIEFEMIGIQTGTVEEVVIQHVRDRLFNVWLLVRDKKQACDYAVHPDRVLRVIEGELYKQ